jgi:hypothetical protein
MGWIADKLSRRYSSKMPSPSASASSETSDLRPEQRWTELMEGLRRDVEEFNRLNGAADFEQISDLQCRVSNAATSVAVNVAVDLDAEIVDYQYEPEKENTPVPENGILTLRQSGRSTSLYSADQRLNSEQARRLILEPVLSAGPARGLKASGT